MHNRDEPKYPGAKSDATTPCTTFHDTQDKGRRFLSPDRSEQTGTKEERGNPLNATRTASALVL